MDIHLTAIVEAFEQFQPRHLNEKTGKEKAKSKKQKAKSKKQKAPRRVQSVTIIYVSTAKVSVCHFRVQQI
ncbi:hypothetical protein POF51_30555 [Brevibacillus sp. AG]|uniref:hypothetical protein n=1 Tax=Brevibacillus sp. AG TaxID=3020891 RepID=UPI00232DF3A3|nr:hypothetical protein [Brevibacillus sp. AG]MDC0765070.1 hypothetical protein [Brevibacillus sp. AG]